MEEKNNGIRIVRFLAMISVFFCHILQAMDNAACFYLNVGVWLFLFISGYIYGNREIKDVAAFYKGRAVRILIPYYLVLASIIAINIFKGENIRLIELVSSALCLQWYGYSVPNCGHLWYISCILFCYLITPVLQWAEKQREGDSLILKSISFAVGVLWLQTAYSLGGMTQVTTRILPFLAGYWISRNNVEKKIPMLAGGGYMLNLLNCFYLNVCF